MKRKELDLQEIKDVLQEQKRYLHEKYHVVSLGVFGSYVRGDQRKTSDIDILVEFDSGIGGFAFIKLKHEISDKLGKEVDLTIKKNLKPHIGKQILKEVVYI
jgi:uncharacterized protein